jgi:hypothetical protein
MDNNKIDPRAFQAETVYEQQMAGVVGAGPSLANEAASVAWEEEFHKAAMEYRVAYIAATPAAYANLLRVARAAPVAPASEQDDWRSAVRAACSHLDYPIDAPQRVQDALRALKDSMRATPPAAEAASAQQEMGTGVQVDDKQTIFIVRKPGLVPRLGRPLGDLAASLREWYEGNPGAEIDLLRVWGTSVSTASIEDGREWQSIFDPEAYKAYKAAASAQDEPCGVCEETGYVEEDTRCPNCNPESAQQDEREALLVAFDAAYMKAAQTSQPADWHEAALLGRQWRNLIVEARATPKVQAGGEDKRDEPDMFWNQDDSERCEDSIHNVVVSAYENGCNVGDIVEVQQAIRLHNIKVRIIADPDDSEEITYEPVEYAALSREQPQGDSNG